MILTEKIVENDDVFLPGLNDHIFHYFFQVKILLTGQIVGNDDVF